MKKLYIFAFSVFTVLTAVAQPGDTTSFPKFKTGDWASYIAYLFPDGPYFGKNSRGDLAMGQVVLNSDSLHPKIKHHVDGVGFKTRRRGTGGPGSYVKFQVYRVDFYNLPDSLLAETNVDFADIKDNAFTWASFANPALIEHDKSYAIAIDFSTLAGPDSIAIYHSLAGEVNFPNLALEKPSSGIWRKTTNGFSSFGDDVTAEAKVAYRIYDPNWASVENNGKDFLLLQNVPNPFRDYTKISYSITKPLAVSLEVYDLTGRLVEVKNEGVKPSGSHNFVLNAANYEQGLYFYVLKAGEHSATRKMSVIR